jgi:hypothetical protein
MPCSQGSVGAINFLEVYVATLGFRGGLGSRRQRILEGADQRQWVGYAGRSLQGLCVFRTSGGDSGFGGFHDANVDARLDETANEGTAHDGFPDAGIGSGYEYSSHGTNAFLRRILSGTR